eukprot:UN06015
MEHFSLHVQEKLVKSFAIFKKIVQDVGGDFNGRKSQLKIEDDKLCVEYIDTEKEPIIESIHNLIYGDVEKDSGWITFREMKHAVHSPGSIADIPNPLSPRSERREQNEQNDGSSKHR